MRTLYPPTEPQTHGYLKVTGPHEIYWEECGNPTGQPVVFVHGGPGAGCDPYHRQFFDPAAYRILLFDQRGCGRSRPHACLEENTTWDLVADMERLRNHLGIDRWVVFGGSWGSTLALAYAETHPDHVSALILRGIFLLRRQEIHWFYQYGAHMIFPDAWEDYLKPIPVNERDNLVAAYHRRLTHTDPQVRTEAALAWSVWEASCSKLYPDAAMRQHWQDIDFAVAIARIECHYFVHDGFFTHSNQLLEGVDRIRHIPAVIVQGRYDIVCPAQSAWELSRRWPEADFQLVPDAGHAATEPGIIDQLIRATDRFRKIA